MTNIRKLPQNEFMQWEERVRGVCVCEQRRKPILKMWTCRNNFTENICF